LTIKFTLDIKNSPEFTYWPLTSAPRRIVFARRVQTYVAHQYSIVKDPRKLSAFSDRLSAKGKLKADC